MANGNEPEICHSCTGLAEPREGPTAGINHDNRPPVFHTTQREIREVARVKKASKPSLGTIRLAGSLATLERSAPE